MLREGSEEQIVEELLPFGFFHDGVDEAIAKENSIVDYYSINEFLQPD